VVVVVGVGVGVGVGGVEDPSGKSSTDVFSRWDVE